MRIISFYTDLEYKFCADKLLDSARKFDCHINMACLEATTWDKAIKRKVSYILDEYTLHGGPLLYLDCDTIIKSKLISLEKLISEHDISVRHRHSGVDKFNCGVMGFGTNKSKLIALLDNWCSRTNRKGEKYQSVDQKPLEFVLDHTPEIDLFDLPVCYNMLPSDLTHNFAISEAVIYHYKYSRTGYKARAWKKRYLNRM